MKFIQFLLLLLFFVQVSCAQQVPEERPHCINEAFDQKISRMINFSVPVIGVKEFSEIKTNAVVFDAREKEEYNISHIEGAYYIGYNDFNIARLKGVPKDQQIVVYCSIGYRSEKIGKQLQKKGYTNVHNLYGSIFEWVNQGYPIVDKNGVETNKLHTYSRKWSQWVEDGKAEEIW